MKDRFASARGKLKRAQMHIADFEQRAVAWAQDTPYERVCYSDVQTREFVEKIELIKPMPEGLNNIAADAIHNLRAALDHATYATRTGTGDSQKAAFPVGDTEALFLACNGPKGGSRDVPKEIFEIFKRLKPYREGNPSPSLWALNKLCNVDKHRTSWVIESASGSVLINPAHGQPVGIWIAIPAKWDVKNNEMEVLRLPFGSTAPYEVNVRMEITFGNVHADIDGKLAVDTLYVFLRGAASIVNRVEKKAIEMASMGNP